MQSDHVDTADLSCSRNLTGANHVIFVAPFRSDDQAKFDQSYTQCIGRARRFGQTKMVYVYRFVVRNTQDVDEYEERLKSKLLEVNDGQEVTYIFKNQKDLSEADKEQQHGTSWFRKA